MAKKIKKGALSFRHEGNGYVCEELLKLPEAFAAKWSPSVIDEAVKTYLSGIRGCFRGSSGGKVFDEVVEELRPQVQNLSLLNQLLYWMSDWWYYNQRILRETTYDAHDDRFMDLKSRTVREFVIPALPEQVREVLKLSRPIEAAVASGHFAILFEKLNYRRDGEIRHIVTDTQLFETDGMFGYAYLSITDGGEPVARSKCLTDGRRAFFDGVRLMSHDSFRTCAPNTVIVQGGYKVNSTGVTIINGGLYDLVDVSDAVARTTGAVSVPPFMRGLMGVSGSVALVSQDQAADSFAKCNESGARMRIEEDNRVFLDDKELSPLGHFKPSEVDLLDSGFCRYDWSEFVKTN